jgi:hypothetical protein|nr:MAG TPA: hypothetical protein [Caudoviricetes sp.]
MKPTIPNKPQAIYNQKDFLVYLEPYHHVSIKTNIYGQQTEPNNDDFLNDRKVATLLRGPAVIPLSEVTLHRKYRSYSQKTILTEDQFTLLDNPIDKDVVIVHIPYFAPDIDLSDTFEDHPTYRYDHPTQRWIMIWEKLSDSGLRSYLSAFEDLHFSYVGDDLIIPKGEHQFVIYHKLMDAEDKWSLYGDLYVDLPKGEDYKRLLSVVDGINSNYIKDGGIALTRPYTRTVIDPGDSPDYYVCHLDIKRKTKIPLEKIITTSMYSGHFVDIYKLIHVLKDKFTVVEHIHGFNGDYTDFFYREKVDYRTYGKLNLSLPETDE